MSTLLSLVTGVFGWGKLVDLVIGTFAGFGSTAVESSLPTFDGVGWGIVAGGALWAFLALLIVDGLEMAFPLEAPGSSLPLEECSSAFDDLGRLRWLALSLLLPSAQQLKPLQDQ